MVPSLWLENSPLVIHEAFQSGVAVVGARLGGIENLVADGINGLLYDAFSSQALAEALRRFLADPGLAPRLAAAAPAVKTLEQDAGEWRRRYETVLRGRS